ncbi:DNA methyltransferase [Methylocystis echinoides]|uniref:class I SAM-dependent DNA methyltransferase n=1 Tax=Methylocystis echinoides TaxID=29468 RepID=UPI003417F08B
MPKGVADSDGSALERFIEKWLGREGGQERANYALFLTEFCLALSLPSPEPAGAARDTNDYVFERRVRETRRDGQAAHRRIDLYKRDCFVLEAKQSRQQKGGEKEIAQQGLFVEEAAPRGRRGAERAWDVLMVNARAQAEGYVRLLPEGHEPPPFVIVCDVGHCFEIYANFRRDGKAFDQFPDRRSFRIHLEELREPEKRALLAAIWTDPLSLDPARKSARVTREIAARLAAVSKALEAARHAPEIVAMFLMRCLFTMFAEDVGLLRKEAFSKILDSCAKKPDTFPHKVGQLWEAMDSGGYAHALEERVARFNGTFFKNHRALSLGREEIGELAQAARYDWREVDPSIFGALLEQALDPHERRRLGAHFTPRAYVERLVVATVIEPLREDWAAALATAERQKSEGRCEAAVATVAAFHDRLCATRVLDPACGTGNFLYVALELLKRLEGEVLEALADLGGQEALTGLEGHSVGPQQFLGLEINARAKAIAELVLWIGHLQWHVRTRGGMPGEPILQAFDNIVTKDAVLEAEKVLKRDARGKPVTRTGPDGGAMEVYEYRNPRRPAWPDAEFIVGNPPFIGGKDVRARLGDDYAQALWAAHPQMNESADFVMYWWDHAAELLTRKATTLRRFGLVTTNSITQVFQRRVVERHLNAKAPVSLVMAIPDHPWTKATKDAAAVRIAMTVVEAGAKEGRLLEVVKENSLETDAPLVDFAEKYGRINSDLTSGADVTGALALKANKGISFRGITYMGSGFIIQENEAALFRTAGEDYNKFIKPYISGRDLSSRPRGVFAIDLFGLRKDEVARRMPRIYQHLLRNVKPVRDHDRRASYRENWWIFAEPRSEFRSAIDGLPAYIATTQTAKHRVFTRLDRHWLPDQTLVLIASDDGFVLGVVCSRIHAIWTKANSASLGVYVGDVRYTNSRTFDPFPFPDADDLQKHRIRQIAEELDAHRKRVLAEHPHLTLTGLYNVLEKLRAGGGPCVFSGAERKIFDDGLVLILKELHERLDDAVAAAYGWPADLAEDEILIRLVALNRERAREEAQGHVRWLRPDYQIPRFGQAQERAELALGDGAARPAQAASKPASPPTTTARRRPSSSPSPPPRRRSTPRRWRAATSRAAASPPRSPPSSRRWPAPAWSPRSTAAAASCCAESRKPPPVASRVPLSFCGEALGGRQPRGVISAPTRPRFAGPPSPQGGGREAARFLENLRQRPKALRNSAFACSSTWRRSSGKSRPARLM